MKKAVLAFALLGAALAPARAEELNFSWSAGADLVSCYIWRGLYNGALSFQPAASLGWTSEHTSLDFGLWGSVGASDWGFRKGLPVTEDGGNPNTRFVKEMDVCLSLNLWGATLGLTHYYYFDGKSFFNFGDVNEVEGSAQTEVSVGYDFSTLLENVDLQLYWNTMVAGSDVVVDGRRAFSSYVEATYTHHFEKDWSLAGTVGVSPWRSSYTDGDSDSPRDFAVNNLTLRADKSWELGKGSFDVFLQGTMNTCNLDGSNALIRASGDDKLSKQKLMAALGVNFSF